MTNSGASRLILVEGPDGAGKTRLCNQLVEATGAHLVHMGPMPQVSSGLARMYVEAMMPALLGHRDVIMDRCWLSEAIYGSVFRGGEDRLGDPYVRMLERVALRCDPLVVLCLPDSKTCVENFKKRKGEEYLDTEEQLVEVYNGYKAIWDQPRHHQAIPTIRYDYTSTPKTVDATFSLIANAFEVGGRHMRLTPSDLELTKGWRGDLGHGANWPTAGALDADYVIVGESFAAHKNTDPLVQFPFVSFSGAGCSTWLTAQLSLINLSEARFAWINADVAPPLLVEFINRFPRKAIIALGDKAKQVLDTHESNFENGAGPVIKVRHPAHAKRFSYKADYELLEQLHSLEAKR